ncbi:MFS transporter [Arenibaculum sp.]|uniref:MFS transporter n=1 Tax=Arenibaculum sp. TaxID=2865862 RepID=UPI002E0F2E8A|nr:MFS transporter [Arenibaculum sp.]
MLIPFRLSAMFAVVFAVVAVQLTFWPVWLAAQGLDAAGIGLIVSIGYWMRTVSDPLAGFVVDRTGSRRNAMVAVALIALGGALLFLTSRTTPVLFLASLLWAGAFAALVPLGDNLALLTAKARGLDYGRLRVWGSIAFVASTWLTARLLTDLPAEAILHTLLAGLAATVLACLFLPEAPVAARPSDNAKASPWPLLRHPVYLRFLLAAGMVQASHGVLYAFGSLHWRGLGLSSTTVGLLWIEGVAVEIALFAFGRRIVDRLGAARLLLVAALAGMVRWSLLAEAESVPWLVLAQALHGLTFGAAHLAAMRFVVEAVPSSHSATGQTLYSGLALGVGYGLSTAASGPLYAALGGGAFLVMAGLCAVSAVTAWTLARHWTPGEPLRLPGVGDGARAGT